MSLLEKIGAYLNKVVSYFVGALLFMMFTLVVLQVLLRYIFQAPLAWTDEAARYLMTWMIFVGACVSSYECSHLGVTILFDKTHGMTRLILATLINICVCIFLFLITIQGYSILSIVKNASSPALQMSMAVPYLCVPIGSGLMLFQTILSSILVFKKK